MQLIIAKQKLKSIWDTSAPALLELTLAKSVIALGNKFFLHFSKKGEHELDR